MKNIFKKNQIVITALAIMIAVAGYLNYSGTKLNTTVNNSAVSSTTAEGDFADISDEDILAENSTAAEDETPEINETGDKSALIDINSLDNDIDEATAEGENASGTDTPGEAVLTNSSTSVGFAAEAKITREQVRSKNKETLLEVINNGNVTDEQKQNAIDSMISMTDIAEREAAAEMLLEAKGFQDVVVSITDATADVVINMSEVTDAGRAQIEDIMKRKTGVAAENIIITPYSAKE